MGDGDIHLRDYLRVVNKRRYTVYTFFVIVFSIFLIATFSMQPVYMASTKVLIEKRETSSLMLNYAYSPYDPEFYETQYQLIKSTSVARKVVDMLHLDRNYDYYFKDDGRGLSLVSGAVDWFKGLFATVFKMKGLEQSEQKQDVLALRADAIARMISKGIAVTPVKNSKIVEISFQSTNPELAKTITDTVAKAYIEEILDLNMSSSRYTLQWMTKKAEEERDRLEKSEKDLQRYVKDQNFVTLENKIAIVPQKMSELNSQLIRAEAKKKEMEVLYSKVKEISGNLDDAETLSVIASDPTLQSLRQQMLKAEEDITTLSQKYGKKHPTLIRAVEDLNGLKAKRKQEIKRIIQSIKNEYELARSNEASLQRMLSEAKGEALSLNEKYIEYEVIHREVETNRQLYEALIKKIKEQSLTEQIQTVNVSIIEKAETPRSPVKPRRGMNVLLGLVIGLFGGVGMAFFVDYLDNTIKLPEEAEARIGVPVFGMIPVVKSGGKSVEDMVMREPSSAFAENFKAIRTALLLSSAVRPPKRVLVTSAGPGEGKTTIAINLSIAVALSEYSVLLIDADLRKPRIHKVFGLSNAKGLSTCLAGTSAFDSIQEGPLPNLSIIPSGPIPPNPSELLSSNRLNEFVETLSEKFDIIICDSPPLLTVTDGLVLGRIVDGTLIVTRSGKTTYENVKRGLRFLHGRRRDDAESHVLGIIINALDIKKDDYSYYRYHNYYYSEEEKT